MKYIVLLCDGMADYPLPELSNQTPLEAAKNPAMKSLAKTAEIGLAKTVPDGMKPGSDVANLSVMGYDPAKYYTGRSPWRPPTWVLPLTTATWRFAAISSP